MDSSRNEILRNYINQHHDNFYDKAAKECNSTVLSEPPPRDGVYCPAVLDDWGICFNFTNAGTIAFMPCPPLSMFNSNALTFRHCEENGTWQVASNNLPWTNITACSQHLSYSNDLMYDQSFSYVYLFTAGATLSFILVTLALTIFYGFRQLRCDRITVHKNLFISYAFSSVTSILYYHLVVVDGMVLLQNPFWCLVLHVIVQYSGATNFSWMFCEGLYLQMIMAQALAMRTKIIRFLVVGGWGMPLLLTVIYAVVRGLFSQNTHSCWVHEDNCQWIIGAPAVATTCINIYILVNLIRLLMTKLKHVPNANEIGKAAKATLILVPLFGLQFLVIPVRPGMDSPWHPVYLHLMSLLLSSQGALVAVIFCFCNGEVRALIRRKWQQYRLMTGNTRKSTGFTNSTLVDGYSVIESTREGTCHSLKVTQDHNHKNTEEIELKPCAVVTTPLVEKVNIHEKAIGQTGD